MGGLATLGGWGDGGWGGGTVQSEPRTCDAHKQTYRAKLPLCQTVTVQIWMISSIVLEDEDRVSLRLREHATLWSAHAVVTDELHGVYITATFVPAQRSATAV